MTNQGRPITPDELLDILIIEVGRIAHAWRQNSSDPRAVDGVVHSILAMLDGESLGLPAFDLVAKPHPDDKKYHQSRGEGWIEDETRISDTLHEHWHSSRKGL